MKKRGALPLKYLYRLIAFFVIIGIFTYAGRIYGSGEAYYKLAIAEDLALTIDLIYSVPGNVVYVYPNEITGYDVEFKDSTVTVYDNTIPKDPLPASYNFAGISGDKLDSLIKKPVYLRFEKTGNKITITGASKNEALFQGGRSVSAGG